MFDRTTSRRARTAACLLTGLLLAGCAAPVRDADPQAGDYGDYVPGPGFHLLMAEIAAQRGVQATAANEFLAAAERSEDPEVSQRAAQFAYEHGFDAHALRAARRWAQLAPEEAAAHLVIARLLIRRNDVRRAVLAAERALGPAQARTGEDYLMLAGELGEEANAEAVTRVMTRLAATAGPRPAVRLAVATAALRSRDIDLALEEARAVVAAEDAGELAVEADVVIGRALFASGDVEAALAHMAQVAAANGTLETGIEHAGLLAAAERYEDALVAIEELAVRYGDAPELQRLRAIVSLNVGDERTAWEEFSTLVREGEYRDECLLYLGEISLKQQRFEQAVQLLSSIGPGPYLLTAQEALSRIAEAQGDNQTALEIWQRVAERYPRYAFDADRHRAAALQRMGEDEQALAVLDEVLQFRPDDAELLLVRGALLEKLGRIEDALDDMARVVEQRPDSAIALNAYGYTLTNRTRRHEEAYRLIRRALERDPGNAAIMDSYGWVLFRLKRLPEARSWLQLAHSELPDPEVAAHLGEVMWLQGEREAARKVWSEALESAPTSRPLLDTMARYVR